MTLVSIHLRIPSISCPLRSAVAAYCGQLVHQITVGGPLTTRVPILFKLTSSATCIVTLLSGQLTYNVDIRIAAFDRNVNAKPTDRQTDGRTDVHKTEYNPPQREQLNARRRYSIPGERKSSTRSYLYPEEQLFWIKNQRRREIHTQTSASL